MNYISQPGIPVTLVLFVPLVIVIAIGEAWAAGYLAHLPRTLRIALVIVAANALAFICLASILTVSATVRQPWS